MKLPDDYTVRLIDMPISAGGMMTECPDGHVDIYINARLSHAGQRRAAKHEFDHWRNDDLHNGRPIREIESDGKRLPKLMKARDLIKPKRVSWPDWRDDVYLSLPMIDEY